MTTREVSAGGEVLGGEVLLEGLGSPDDWFQEGLAEIEVRDGGFYVDAMAGGYSAFWKKPLPANMLACYTCRVLPSEDSWHNINIISHCRPKVPGEWPIVEGGKYKGYRELDNYIVTFLKSSDEERAAGDGCTGRQRLRRNPGFQLVDEKLVHPSEPEVDYLVTFAVQDGRVRYWIGEQLIFDWQDPEPITGEGFFALRTWQTISVYKDILILALR
ncbi:MAG: DUF6250 domain-containing protein [Planctomycetota bacterium]